MPATALRRFRTTLAHSHGQTWNAADPARPLGVSESTARRYLDLLTDAFMARQPQPWHANLRKRQVKAPKAHVRDSDLLHQLLGIDTAKALMSHPKFGASWEVFAIEQVLVSDRPGGVPLRRESPVERRLVVEHARGAAVDDSRRCAGGRAAIPRRRS